MRSRNMLLASEGAAEVVRRNDNILFYTSFILDLVEDHRLEAAADLAHHYSSIVAGKISSVSGPDQYTVLLHRIKRSLSDIQSGTFPQNDTSYVRRTIKQISPFIEAENAELRKSYGL